MPIIDGVLDIPALEWCSVRDAVFWIEFGQVPVEPRYENMIAGRIPWLSLDANMRIITYPQSLCKLVALSSLDNGVKLRGKPAEGLRSVRFDTDGVGLVECDVWGYAVEIPLFRLKDNASELAFKDASLTGVLRDSRIFATEELPDTFWAYSEVVVSFSDLIRLCPRDGSESIRVGGEAQVVAPNSNKEISRPPQPKTETKVTPVSFPPHQLADTIKASEALPYHQGDKSNGKKRKREIPPDADRVCESVKEFYEAMGIGKSTFYKHLKAGKIKTVKIGRRTLVPLTERQAYLRLMSGEDVV